MQSSSPACVVRVARHDSPPHWESPHCQPTPKHAQRERLSLRQRLPAAISFIWQHLAEEGRAIFVTCDDGLDASVCVALAAMLLQRSRGGAPGKLLGGDPPEPGRNNSCSASSSGSKRPPKQRVRQQLAALSATYPAAQPTRANLKMVSNFVTCLECGCASAALIPGPVLIPALPLAETAGL